MLRNAVPPYTIFLKSDEVLLDGNVVGSFPMVTLHGIPVILVLNQDLKKSCVYLCVSYIFS